MKDVWKWIATLAVGILLGGGGAAAFTQSQISDLRTELEQIRKEAVELVEENKDDRDAMVATMASQIDFMKSDLAKLSSELVRLNTIIEERIPRKP